MSWEEDYLMGKVRDLEGRVAGLERLVSERWAGSSSPTSTGAQPTSTPSSEPNPQPPAPTTGSPSKKDSEGSSTALSTDGPGREMPKANDPKQAWADWAAANGYDGDPWDVSKADLIEWARNR